MAKLVAASERTAVRALSVRWKTGVAGLVGLMMGAQALAQDGTQGNLAALSYSPSPGQVVSFSGVTTVGSTGSASITITPTSFVTGDSATFNNCNISGVSGGGNFGSTAGINITLGSPPASQVVNLSCSAGGTTTTGTLQCSERINLNNPLTRSWPVSCPAGTPINTPPTLVYTPAPNGVVSFTAPSSTIGSTATGSIRLTPTGGFGTGPDATTSFSNCVLSQESFPGTFQGFSGTDFSFVGNGSSPQSINMSCRLRPQAASAKLTCQERRGQITPLPRSWDLSCPEGEGGDRLVLSKTASANSVAGGSEFSFTLSVTNPDNLTAQTGIVLLDELPASLSFISASGDGWTCSEAGGRVDCRRPTLANLATSNVLIRVRAPNTAQTVVNTGSVSSLESRVPTTATASVEILAPSQTVDLSIDKRDSADPVAPGQAFTYILSVRNLGQGTATDVSLAEFLPFGLTLTNLSGNGWNCSTAPMICRLIGNLPGGATAPDVIAQVVAGPAATVVNRATVSSREIDSNPANNEDSESTLIRAEQPRRADLAVSASANPQSTFTGRNVEFRADIRNLGPDDAAGVSLSIAASAALEVQSAAGTGWECQVGANGGTCTRGPTANGFSGAVTVQTRVRNDATGTAEVRFNLSSATADPVLSNNEARASVSFQPGGADLVMSKTDSVDPVRAGAEFSYTLSVRNAGPEAASGVRVLDNVPAALRVVSATGNGLSCSVAGQVVTCTAATLAANATATATLVVRAPTTGQAIDNTAEVSATSSDPNAANNRATQNTRINDRDAQDLTQLLNPAGTDPVARAAIPALADACARPAADVAQQCREIVAAADGGRNAEVTEALRALAPEEALAQSLVLREIAATQFQNVDARLNELRRGGGGFSMSGLTVMVDGQPVPVSLLNDALRASLGLADDAGGLISNWGFFLNGTISSGEQDLNRTRGNVGADYESRGITAGVDYRFSPRLVAGGAIGYSSYDVDLSGDSTLESSSLMFTGYGSYYLSDRLYIDSRLSYGQIGLDLDRRVRFRVGNLSVDQIARGETDATQLSFASAMGYHLNYGPWSVTPNAALRFTSSDIDGFVESGAGPNNLRYADTSLDSTLLSVGVQVSRALSLTGGVLMPQLDLSYNHASGADDFEIESRFANGISQVGINVEEQDPDSSYGTAGLGFVYLMGNGRQAYLNYRRVFGYTDFDRGSLNLGGRFEF